MVIDPFNIERAKLVGFSGDVPFTVVRLSETEYGVKEEPHVQYDFYYMRTGNSRQDAINRAKSEFEEYMFTEERFNPEWVSGVYRFLDKAVELEINQDTLKGFNFWVAEGLLGKFYKDNFAQEKFPNIKTLRRSTQRLYERMLTDCYEAKESGQDLVSLLTDQEEACSIILAPTYLDRTYAFHAANGNCPAKFRIMNYGRIWGEHSSFFEDPNTGACYQLINKNIIPKRDRAFYREKFGKEFPKLGIVSKINGFIFREVDKIGIDKSYLFFDGTLQDIFKILQKAGIKFEEGVLSREA